VLKGQSKNEIFLSTYICHPTMANNELSGPVVATELIKFLSQITNRKYTYRIVFVPETIGSITYLSKNLRRLKRRVIAGFNLTCLGDDRSYSMMPSRMGNTISDAVAKHALRWITASFKLHSWLDRGSDERQYCAPGIDLPIVSIMRTKYADYPEYHTSLDDLETVVTPNGLAGGFAALRTALMMMEFNVIPQSKILCEPQLGRRGLYSTLGGGRSVAESRLLLNVISFSDGHTTCLEIAELLNKSFSEVRTAISILESNGVVELKDVKFTRQKNSILNLG
jgi:aminopeptidase-like protein